MRKLANLSTATKIAPAINRRSFLRQLTWLAGAAGLANAPALLAERSPNSKLAVAVIGCGGRGEASLEAALGEQLIALVDVDETRLAAAERKSEQQGAKPRKFFDYRRMFDSLHREIDAVFVATPDHHHAPASLRAMRLGKHVFCEKPLCHDIQEARLLAETARKHRVVTMMGNQGHCGDGYRLLCEYLWAGAIGELRETHSWSGFVNGGAGHRPAAKPIPAGLHWDEWLGPAPSRDYHDGLHPAYWRYFRDFGTGGLGDWGCHNLDGVFWALHQASPSKIECLGQVGGGAEKHPQASVIRWEVAAPHNASPVRVHWYDGASLKPSPEVADLRGQISHPNYPPMLAEWERRTDTNFREGWDGGTFYIGTKGVMHTGCYGQRPRLLPEEAHLAFPTPTPTLPRIRGSHFSHFLNCCKTGTPTCADFDYAARITEFLLLGHLAIQAGISNPVEWDSKRGHCKNHPELNHHLGRKYRKGW